MDGEIVLKEDLQETTLGVSALELRIIKAIAKGKTSKEIAKEWGKSFKTVETQRHNMLKRLGCNNMPHLINMCWEQKILS